jgi:hypothetical protein
MELPWRKKPQTETVSKLKPVPRFVAPRKYFGPTSKGNELPAAHLVPASEKDILITRNGPHIPLLQRDIKKLGIEHETYSGVQAFHPYFQAMNEDGLVVGLEESMNRLDDESFENLLETFREHRGGHLDSFYYPNQLSEFIIDFSLLASSLSKTDKNSKAILSEELRLDTAKLLGYIERNVAYPVDPRGIDSVGIIINTVLLFEFLKKIAPEVKLVSWLEKQTKQYLDQNVAKLPADSINKVGPAIAKFKESFLEMKKENFGPNYPSVERDKEHGDFYMAQEYLANNDFYEYLDNFGSEEELKNLFSFIIDDPKSSDPALDKTN